MLPSAPLSAASSSSSSGPEPQNKNESREATVHAEAAPGITPDTRALAAVRWPVVFLPLFAPFGISSGYVSVTLAFLLGRAGLPTATIAMSVMSTSTPMSTPSPCERSNG